MRHWRTTEFKRQPNCILFFFSGADPSQEDWKVLAEICKKKNHFPVFDMAYQVLTFWRHLPWYVRGPCTLSSHLVTASVSFIVGSCIITYAPSLPIGNCIRFLHCRVTRPVTATRTRLPSVISLPRVWCPRSRSPFPKTWVSTEKELGLYPSFVKTKKRKTGLWAR